MQHFLPRILEGIVRGEDIRCLEEMQLDKLCCDLPQVWTPGQLDFMRRFARAWFVRQLTAAPDYGDPAAALVMFHHAGLDTTAELLDIWTRHAACLPALPAFVAAWAALPAGGKKWRQDFYLPADRRDPAAFHTALETALLENQAPPTKSPCGNAATTGSKTAQRPSEKHGFGATYHPSPSPKSAPCGKAHTRQKAV